MSKSFCQLHRAAAALLAAGVALLAAVTAGGLVYGRMQSGVWSGEGSWTGMELSRAADWLSRMLALHGGATAGGAGVLLVLALLVCWLEARPLMQRTPRLVLSRGGMGEVAINLNQVGLLAQHETEQVRGVREVQTSTASSKAGLDVRQVIAVEPETAFPPLAEQVQQRVKQSLEYQLGFPVKRVQVLLQHASLSKSVI